MGMSLSQVRLLTVTSRMKDVENEVKSLSEDLASLGVGEKLTELLEESNLTEFSWDSANIQTLLNSGYVLKVRNMANVLNAVNGARVKIVERFTDVGREGEYLLANGDIVKGGEIDEVTGAEVFNLVANNVLSKYGKGRVVDDCIQFIEDYEEKIMSSVDKLWINCSSMKELQNVIGVSEINDTNEFLKQMVANNNMVICNWVRDTRSKTNRLVETVISTKSDKTEVDEAVASILTEAESEYESAIKRIEEKSKKYDMALASIDNQRNSLAKQLRSFNINTDEDLGVNFKLFS